MYSGKERAFRANRVTATGSVVNFILTSVKFAAGIWGGSAAMVADAVHSLSDFATDIVVIVTMSMAKKPRDSNHDYGHGKFETLASLIIGSALFFVGLGIGWNGLKSVAGVLGGKSIPSPHYVALFAAALSIVVKEILYRWTVKVGKEINSQAVIANAWHHRSDALSSIGTLAGIGGAILLGQSWTILDPIASVVVSAFILKVALQISYESTNQLLECSISGAEKARILGIISGVDGVKDPHNLKTRNIGNNIAVDVHIRVSPDLTVAESHGIATNIESAVRETYGDESHVSVHVEPAKD